MADKFIEWNWPVNPSFTVHIFLQFTFLTTLLTLASGKPKADHGGYGAPHSGGYGAPSYHNNGYGAPSSSYNAPSYHEDTYGKDKVVHIHHHHHHGEEPKYHKPSYYPQPHHYAPAPSYHSSSSLTSNSLFHCKYNKSGDFRMTHQATANRWSLSTHKVSVVTSV